jgi:hypothetical protein
MSNPHLADPFPAILDNFASGFNTGLERAQAEAMRQEGVRVHVCESYGGAVACRLIFTPDDLHPANATLIMDETQGE